MSKNTKTLRAFHFIATVLIVWPLLLISCGGGNNSDAETPALPPNAFVPPPVPEISPSNTFNTEEFKANYGLQAINAHIAYAEGVTRAGTITVAIIDDGIDVDHPDLVDNLSPLSIDIRTGNFADINTQETHGTQIAGIIAAEKNDVGIHGVSYASDIMMIRALDQDGSIAGLVAGIDYARENRADILNLSVNISTLTVELRAALDRAVDAGMLIVISAGNSLPNDPAIKHLDAVSQYSSFDSAKGQVLAVGAIDANNNLFFLSNRPGREGANFYILAPGVDIISSTVGGGLWELTPDPNPQFFGVDRGASGASFATPHVAGAAAVLWQMFPNMTAEEVAATLLVSAVDVGAPGVDAISGHGIIDLGAAIRHASNAMAGATKIPAAH